MCLGCYRSGIDISGIGCNCQTAGNDGALVFHDKVRCCRQGLHEEGETCAGVPDNRQQLFTQLYRHLMELFLAFIKIGLYGIVHNTELLDDAVTLLVSLCCQSLAFAYIVNLICHGGEHTDGTGTIQPHVIEHFHHCLRILTAQTVGQIEDSLVSILIQKLREVLDALTGNTGEFLRVGLHLCKHVAKCSGCHLITQQVLIHHGTVAHYLRLCETQLLAEACNACRIVNEETSLCAGVLRQFVDSGTGCQHGATQSHPLILSEGHSQFTYLVYGTIAKIITEGNLDFVGSIYEFENAVLCLDA